MQDWLRAQRPVRARHVVVAHDDDAGHAHRRTQLKALDAAKGVEFDRAFLTLMIQHHDGALKMVKDLLRHAARRRRTSTSPCSPTTSSPCRPPRSASCTRCWHSSLTSEPTPLAVSPGARTAGCADRRAWPSRSSARSADVAGRADLSRPATIRATDLKPGRSTPATAASDMRLVSFTPKPAEFDTARGLTFINSDLAFRDHYVYQGNFAGFTIWDVSNPAKPQVVVGRRRASRRRAIRRSSATCSSSPPRAAGNRNDCAKGGVQDPKDHMAGVRIFDVSNPKAPKLVKNVQTCKGSHTHTVDPESDGQGRRLHLRVGQPGRAAGDRARRVHGTGRIRPTRRTRCSGSTSSRCRSPTPRRPRW